MPYWEDVLVCTDLQKAVHKQSTVTLTLKTCQYTLSSEVWDLKTSSNGVKVRLQSGWTCYA